MSASGTRWLPADDLHEFLYSGWIFAADEAGIHLDFHLPGCTATPDQVIATLTDFLHHAVPELDPELPRYALKDPNEKWLMVSGLQKAIRRSDFDAAWRCASAMFNSGQAAYMWRRFAITMLEDVGVADPYAAALVSLAASSKPLRLQIGEKRLLAYLLAIACDTPKSRDLCDTIEMLAIDARDPEFISSLSKMTLEQRISTATNEAASFADRMAAYATTFGARWGGSAKADIAARDSILEALGIPVLFRVLTTLNYRATGEALNIPLPFVYAYLLQSAHAEEKPDYFPGSIGEKVNGLHSAAYDKHTWAGKAAVKKFIAACSQLGKRLYEYGVDPSNHVAAIERAIFYTEGGILSPRLSYQGSDSIYYEVLARKVTSGGQLPNLDAALEFYKLVRDNISTLRQIRLFHK